MLKNRKLFYIFFNLNLDTQREPIFWWTMCLSLLILIVGMFYTHHLQHSIQAAYGQATSGGVYKRT